MNSRNCSLTGCLWLVLILSLVLTASAVAETYVSYNGQFQITYPDTWEQVDYRTADFYIRQATGALDYEAVFADKQSPKVFEGVYVIMTLDTNGGLSQSQIDSAVSVVSESFDRPKVEIPLDSFPTGLTLKDVAYDPDRQILAAMSDVTDEGSAPRKNILVQKFYDRGMANFYFYSPDSLLSESMTALTTMLASFSTDLTQVEKKPVKIADIDARRDSKTTRYIILFVGLAVILIGIIAVRSRQRKKH